MTGRNRRGNSYNWIDSVDAHVASLQIHHDSIALRYPKSFATPLKEARPSKKVKRSTQLSGSLRIQSLRTVNPFRNLGRQFVVENIFLNEFKITLIL